MDDGLGNPRIRSQFETYRAREGPGDKKQRIGETPPTCPLCPLVPCGRKREEGRSREVRGQGKGALSLEP